MNNKTFQYKDYYGTIEPDLEDNCLRGKVLHINDLITYEAETVSQLEKEFRFSVDDYLKLCDELGREPLKPFKGSFNVRIDPEKHKKLAIKASQNEGSINEIVKIAIEQYLDNNPVEVTHKHTVEGDVCAAIRNKQVLSPSQPGRAQTDHTNLSRLFKRD